MREEELGFIADLAVKAGDYFAGVRPLASEISGKEGRGNFVTRYDTAVQKMIRDSLGERFPDCGFIGEEDELHTKELPDRAFIVDPIDGTANFINGYGHSAVSIAYAEHGRTVLGAVYDPYLKELFTASRGEGAWLNGEPIHVSERGLQDAYVMFGMSPYNRECFERSLRILRRFCESAADLRNSGSAALDVCYVAAGKVDIFYELVLSPWDYAAAGLILEEAGGVIRTCEGGEVSLTEKSSVVAASAENYEQIRTMLE